ncbi:MAG: hypothetical protein RSD28_07455 [Lachnospiraceae bacterium]
MNTIQYITSNAYSQIVNESIKNCELVCTRQEIGDQFEFQKYIKQNINTMADVDLFLVDLSALEDLEEEIQKTFEMMRYMYNDMRIVILAVGRYPGNKLLLESVNMGIYNIINTDDFVEIKKELQVCFLEGMNFKTAMKFKTAEIVKESVKQEIKKTVSKVLVSVAGAQKHIGTTHTCISLAAFLRKKGFMVAIVEMHDSTDLRLLRDLYGEEMVEDHFTIDGIDFYKEAEEDMLTEILNKPYHFVIADFGVYDACNAARYHRGIERIIVSGSKAWEFPANKKIFNDISETDLKEMKFLFNYAPTSQFKIIREGMDALGKIFFLTLEGDPFIPNLPEAEELFFKYLPEKKEPEKKGWFFANGKSKK